MGDLNTIFLRNVPPEAFNYAQRVGRAGRRVGFPGIAITYCKRGPHDLYHFLRTAENDFWEIESARFRLLNEKIITRHITATALSEFFRTHTERFVSVEALCGEILQPSITSEVRNYLSSRRTQMESTLRGIVPESMWSKIGVNDGSWIIEGRRELQ